MMTMMTMTIMTMTMMTTMSMIMTMMPMMTKVGWVSERAVLGEADNDHVKLYQHSSMVINLQVCLFFVYDLFIVCLLFVYCLFIVCLLFVKLY